MHVLYLHQYFVPPDGTGGTRSYEIARRIVKAGHKVTLVTSSAYFPSNYRFEKNADLELDGIHLKVIDIPYSNRLSYWQRIWAFISFAFRSSIASLKVKDVDIVFATSTPLTIALPGIAAKIRHRCPMIFEVRDLWPELPVAIGALRNPFVIFAARWLEKTAYRNSARIIALSPGMRDGVIRTGYPPDMVTVISNSCDNGLFRVPEESGREFLAKHPYLKGKALVTYAGTLGLINGVCCMIDIAAAMKKIDPSVHFLVAGDGKEKNKVLERARLLNVLEKNLWIIPPVAKSDMPGLLSASTVAASFVIDLPELWNNSANKFFDALAAGRPLMINHRGWQADILLGSGAGIVVPPNDPTCAARELHAFLNSKERLKKARTASAFLADTEFNRDRLVEKLIRLFEEVLDEK